MVGNRVLMNAQMKRVSLANYTPPSQLAKSQAVLVSRADRR